jgi:membrane protein implicated in regulation of membrane protease activity
MILWWQSLDIAQQIFALVGIGAPVILLIQTVLLLFGLDDDADVDFDGDADVDVDLDGADGLALFSVRGIVAMLAILGWTGVVFLGTDMPRALAIALAIVCGLLTLVAMAYIMRGISRLQSSGNIDVGNCIGKVGQVYLPIKPGATAPGKVNITVQGTYSEFLAITTAERVLPTGSYVRVVGVEESGVLLVEPIDNQK